MAFDRLLLIDDSDIDNLVNKRIVEKSGFASNIVVKNSALSALEYLREIQTDLLPEIIFLDIRMPEIDGFEFLNRFDLLDEEIKKHCSIVMLSSSIDSEDFRRAMENPYVIHFINKPLTREAIEEIGVK
jgi:CheY-like chemotaxis protein